MKSTKAAAYAVVFLGLSASAALAGDPEMVSAGGAMARVAAPAAEAPVTSVARTPKVNVPDCAGTPASTPVGRRLRPVGRAPEEMVHE